MSSKRAHFSIQTQRHFIKLTLFSTQEFSSCGAYAERHREMVVLITFQFQIRNFCLLPRNTQFKAKMDVCLIFMLQEFGSAAAVWASKSAGFNSTKSLKICRCKK